MSVVRGATDASLRTAYRVAHRGLRAWWFLRRPTTTGALAAVWYGGEVLLVKNSYRREYTLPGGYAKPGEDPRGAAARELQEETGIALPSSRFAAAYHGVHPYENRRDVVDICEVVLEELPDLHIDGREVIWAGFRSPAAARAMALVPHLYDYLAGR